MKNMLFMIAACGLCASAAFGQMVKRTDAIWARTTTATMTVDGALSEPSWASAESLHIRYGLDNGMPGSGWRLENGRVQPTDSTRATVKFLVKGDSLYVGVRVLDKSVGGGPFNRFDGVLSRIQRKEQTNRPLNAGEIFYAWVKEGWADTLADQPGRMPFFGGPWGSSPYSPRSDSLKAIWNAATTVQGTQNNDSDVDVGYTMEFKINLAARGYTVSAPAGDIAMYSLSIYDNDYNWPLDTTKQSGNRAWAQCPWGNANSFGHIRVHARPDVGLTGAVPTIPADFRIPNAQNYASPNMDGMLTEPVWTDAPSIRLQFGNTTIRNAYPGTAPFRSGQFQPNVNGGQAVVADPSLATVKYFYKNDTLFFGFDVNDIAVQAPDIFDRWDGLRVTMNQRNQRNSDSVLITRMLTFRVSPTGTAKRENDLSPAGWDSLAQAVQVTLALKPGTTIDTTGLDLDAGYTAEMRVVLPRFGYPAGRGDGILFFGITLFDGDSFTPATNSYGTRTWFMREGDSQDGPIWAWMDPSYILTDVIENSGLPSQFALLGNYPNPFNPSTTIKFVTPQQSDVTLEVFNMLGQRVAVHDLGSRSPGEHAVPFTASNLASGVYNYRLRMATTNATVTGKMMLLK